MRKTRLAAQGVAALTGVASGGVVVIGTLMGMQGVEDGATGLMAAIAALPPTVLNLLTVRWRAPVWLLRTTLFVNSLLGGIAWAGTTSASPSTGPVFLVFALLFLAAVIFCVLRDLARDIGRDLGPIEVERVWEAIGETPGPYQGIAWKDIGPLGLLPGT